MIFSPRYFSIIKGGCAISTSLEHDLDMATRCKASVLLLSAKVQQTHDQDLNPDSSLAFSAVSTFALGC